MTFKAHLSMRDTPAERPRLTLAFGRPISRDFQEGIATTPEDVVALWHDALPAEWETFFAKVLGYGLAEQIEYHVLNAVISVGEFTITSVATDFEDVPNFMARLSNVAFYETSRALVVEKPVIITEPTSAAMVGASKFFRPCNRDNALRITEGSSLEGLTPLGKRFVTRVLRDTRATHVSFPAAQSIPKLAAKLTLKLPSEEEFAAAIFGRNTEEEDAAAMLPLDAPWHCQVPIIGYPSEPDSQDIEQLSELFAETLGVKYNS